MKNDTHFVSGANRLRFYIVAFLLLLAGLVLGPSPVRGQTNLSPLFLKASGPDMRDHAGQGQVVPLRGVSVEWMSYRFYSWNWDKLLASRFGIQTKNQVMDVFLKQWLNTNDLDAMQALGYNLIRVPFCFKNFLELSSTNLDLVTDNQYVTNNFTTNGFIYMDWIVQEASKRGMYCMLDFHDLQGWYPYAPETSFTSADQANAVFIWTKIAAHFAGNPWVIGYDLINEPGGVPTTYFDVCYKAIRPIDPDHTLFFETWSPFQFPSGYTNVVCSAHYPDGNGYIGPGDYATSLEQEYQRLRAIPTNSTLCIPLQWGEYFNNYSFAPIFEDNNPNICMWMWKYWYVVSSQEMVGMNTWLSTSNYNTLYAFMSNSGNTNGPLITSSLQTITNTLLLLATPPNFNPNWYSTQNRDNMASPVVVNDAFNVPLNGTISLEASDLVVNDTDLATTARLSAGRLSGCTNGQIIQVGTEWIYTPNPGFTGTDTLTYYAYDLNNRRPSGWPGTVTLSVGTAPDGCYWPLDSIAGGTTPDVNGTNAGTLNGGPVAIAGRVGNALSFSTGQNVSTSVTYNNPNVFTLAAWVNTTAVNVNLMNFGNATGTSSSYISDRQLRLDSSGHVQFKATPANSISSTASINDGTWHHVAASLSPAGMRLYVDGLLVAQNTAVTNAQNYNGYWNIGQMNASSSLPFTGSLDEVHIYQRRLGSAEIMVLAQVSAVAPTAPANVMAAMSTNETQVTLSWTPTSTNATGYVIERRPEANTNFYVVGSVAGSVTNWVDPAVLTPLNRYYYRVRAVNPAGDSLTTIPLVGNATWIGSDQQNWNAATNWLGNAPSPSAACNLLFNQPLARTSTNGLTGLMIYSLTITNGAGANTFWGNPVTLSGPLTVATTQPQDINLDMALLGPQSLSIPSGGQVTLDGKLSDGTLSGGINLSGGGILLMTSNNTFTAGLNINGGTVVAKSPSALGAAGSDIDFGSGSSSTAILNIQTDTTVNNYTLSSGSGNGGTVYFGRATSGAGFQHTMGSIWASSITFFFNKGANITSGNAGVSFTDLQMGGGNDYSPVTLAGNADISIGNAYQNANFLSKRLQLDGTSTNNVVRGSIYDGNAAATVNLIKANSGTWTLNGNSTYTGTTTVNAGKLVVNGQINNSSSVTVSSGATLGGSGTIAAPVTINSGGTLAPGGTAIGALAINNSLTLGGNLSVRINKSSSPVNDTVVVSGTVTKTGGGTLTVVTNGPALANGDRFVLFNKAVSGGNLFSISGGGVAWNNNLAVDGSISVTTGGVTVTNLIFDANLAHTGAQDGAGTWDMVTSNWWGGTNVLWSGGNAIFGAGTDGAMDSYAVNVTSSLAVSNLAFLNTGYILSSGTAVTISNLASYIPSLFVASSEAASIGTNVTIYCANGPFYFGWPAGSAALSADVPAGTLNVRNGGKLRMVSNSSFILDGSGAVYNVYTGGTIAHENGSGKIQLGAATNSGATTTLNIQGGTVTSVGSPVSMYVGNSGNGTLNLENGTVTLSAALNLGNSAAGVAAVNLDGGILTLGGVTSGAGNGTFNLNGGTLRAAKASTNFLFSLTGVYVRNGGAIIDDGGFAITDSQALLHSTNVLDNATDGGLTKLGAGTLTLTGTNTYTGPTIISAGTLALGGIGSMNSSPLISLTNGATLDVSAFSSYALSTNTALSSSGGGIKGSSGGTVSLGAQPIMLACNGTGRALTVTQAGTLILNGNSITVSNATNVPLAVGTNHLIQVGSGTSGVGGSAPVLNGSVAGAGVAAGTKAFLQVNGGYVDLVVASYPAATLNTVGSGGSLSLTFGTQIGFNYTVLYKSNLTDSSWTPVASFGGDGTTKAFTPTINGASGFYFLQVQ